jgi:cell division protein FtsL
VTTFFPSFGPAVAREEGHPGSASGASFGSSFSGRANDPSTIRRHIDRRGLLRFGALAAACCVVAAAALFQIWVRTQVTQEAYRLTRLTKAGRDLESTRRSLQGEEARLRSPPRIESLAREKLGMGPAKAEQVLILTDNTRPAKAQRGPAVARR